MLVHIVGVCLSGVWRGFYVLIDCTKPLSANLLNTDGVVPARDDLLACSLGL